MRQSWIGRIVGAVIGLLFFNPLTALIGFAIGWYFVDRKRNLSERNRQEASQAFSYRSGGSSNFEVISSTFALMGYVARGAGRVNESHVARTELFIQQLRMDDAGRNRAIEAFNRGKDSNFNLGAEIARLQGLARGNDFIYSVIFDIVVQLALADGNLDQGEYDRILQLGSMMGFSKASIDRSIRMTMARMQFEQAAEAFRRSQQQGYQGGQGWGGYSGQQSSGSQDYSNQGGYSGSSYQSTDADLQHAYDILGVERTDSFEEIKKAHRRLMLKYHPDRVASQGLPPEMVEMYTKKAQDIQAAFDLIKKERGEK